MFWLLANSSEIMANSRCQNSQIAIVSKLADKLFGIGRFVSSDQYKAKNFAKNKNHKIH